MLAAGRRVLAATVLAVTVLAAGLSGCGTQSAAAGNVITVSTGACGAGWHQCPRRDADLPGP